MQHDVLPKGFDNLRYDFVSHINLIFNVVGLSVVFPIVRFGLSSQRFIWFSYHSAHSSHAAIIPL